jgi:hypothetical protein
MGWGRVLVARGVVSWFVWVWAGVGLVWCRVVSCWIVGKVPTYLNMHVGTRTHVYTLPTLPTHLDALATSARHPSTQPSDSTTAPHNTTQHIPTPTSPYYPFLSYTTLYHTTLAYTIPFHTHPPDSVSVSFPVSHLPFHSLPPHPPTTHVSHMLQNTLRQPPAPPPTTTVTTDGGPLRCAHAPSAQLASRAPTYLAMFGGLR